jgi:hypothetical protein
LVRPFIVARIAFTQGAPNLDGSGCKSWRIVFALF